MQVFAACTRSLHLNLCNPFDSFSSLGAAVPPAFSAPAQPCVAGSKQVWDSSRSPSVEAHMEARRSSRKGQTLAYSDVASRNRRCQTPCFCYLRVTAMLSEDVAPRPRSVWAAQPYVGCHAFAVWLHPPVHAVEKRDPGLGRRKSIVDCEKMCSAREGSERVSRLSRFNCSQPKPNQFI